MHMNTSLDTQNTHTHIYPKQGNISLELVKTGLARVVDYSIDYTSRDNATQYRIAERDAKAQQLRIWKGYTPKTITGTKEFGATVIEVRVRRGGRDRRCTGCPCADLTIPTKLSITPHPHTPLQILSGDTVVVKPEGSESSASGVGEERKLSLSSLRAPRQVRFDSVGHCRAICVQICHTSMAHTHTHTQLHAQGNRSQAGEPWSAEAKEHLRNR